MRISLGKLILAAFLAAGLGLSQAYPNKGNSRQELEELGDGRQAAILGSLGAALAPVLGAIIGPILSNIATSITNGFTAGLAALGGAATRDSKLEMYMMQVPGAPGPYLLLTTPINKNSRPNINKHYTDDDVDDVMFERPTYNRINPESDHSQKQPYYESYPSTFQIESDQSDEESYLGQYQNLDYKRQSEPSPHASITKIYPPASKDSFRQALNSKTSSF